MDVVDNKAIGESVADRATQMRDMAVVAGKKLARGIFVLRGNHSEIHLSEDELATSLALAFEHGAKAVALRTLKEFEASNSGALG